MRVTTIFNEKGGVAKTVTAIQLAAGKAKRGKRVLLIDGDPQGDATQKLFTQQTLREIRESGKTISEVMIDPNCIRDCIRKVESGETEWYIIPSTGSLNGTMYKLQMDPIKAYPVSLKRALRKIADDFDDVIIDNNPNFGLFVMNAVIASDMLIIPTNIEDGSISRIGDTLRDIRENIEKMDEVKPLNYMILPTMIDRLRVDKDLLDQLRHIYPAHIYESQIRTQKKAVKMAGFEKKILIEDQKSNVANDYRIFIDEVIAREESK